MQEHAVPGELTLEGWNGSELQNRYTS
jgi:hypothetical protein